MRTLAVIPARGGSKGLPRKNLAPLAGVPLLVHTIRAAQAARSLDRTVVSTDDAEIAAVAREAGAEVVERPAALAGDDSRTEEALTHAVEALGEPRPAIVVTLEPTSPLRTARLIDECVALLEAKGAASVLTVTEDRSVFGRLEDGRFRHLEPGQPRLRQLREPLYRESSTVYVTRTESLVTGGSVLAEPVYAVVVSPEEAVDVNSELDLLVAEAILRRRPSA